MNLVRTVGHFGTIDFTEHLASLGFINFNVAGIAFANKIEYLPYFLFLFLLLFFSKIDIKKKAVAAGAFFIVPVLSFGVLFIQGVGLKDFYNAFVLINDIVKTPALDYFYKNYGLYYNSSYLRYSLATFFKLLAFLVPAGLLLYGFNYIIVNVVENKFLKNILNVFNFILLLFVAYKMFPIYLSVQLSS